MKFLGSYPAAGVHAHDAREHADARWRSADDWVAGLARPHRPLTSATGVRRRTLLCRP